MKLDLRLFGGSGSSSGSKGAATKQKTSGNKYKASFNYWKKQTGSGMADLFRDLERAAGGELKDEIVSVQFKYNTPLGKILAGYQQTGGTDDFYITKVGGFLHLNTNRAGLLRFAENMKRRAERGGKWW